MADRLWVLGASDPEMAAIRDLLADAGEQVVEATADGARVHAGNAYRCDPVPGVTHWIECSPDGGHDGVTIDHHRPGDPGYGRPPQEFLAASSIGQVYAALRGYWGEPSYRYQGGSWGLLVSVSEHGDGTSTEHYASVPGGVVLCAAADHCLAAAYRGECPGVGPDELVWWRAELRAAHQGRPVAEVVVDVALAKRAVDDQYEDQGRHGVADMRGYGVARHDCEHREVVRERSVRSHKHGCPSSEYGGPWCNGWSWSPGIPELPEAACRLGVPVLAGPLDCPDGRRKVVLQSADEPTIEAFLRGEIAPELIDRYGDPARGFAGGYLPAD